MEDFKAVSKYVHEGLTFLELWQFEKKPDAVCQSALLGDRLLVSYSSDKTEITVNIYFSSATADKPEEFSAFINSSNGGSIYLDEYLREHQQPSLLGFFRNTEPGKPLREFSLTFTGVLRGILKNECNDFLLGRTELPPFDWGPYK